MRRGMIARGRRLLARLLGRKARLREDWAAELGGFVAETSERLARTEEALAGLRESLAEIDAKLSQPGPGQSLDEPCSERPPADREPPAGP